MQEKKYWNESLGFYRYKCSYVKTKLCSFPSFPICSSPPRVTSPGMYMHTILRMCTLLTLKSISKQAGSLDTFLCHSNSWNTRCGRVLALQKVYKNLFSLLLSPLVWGKEKKNLQLRDLAILFLMAQSMDDFKFCCTNKIIPGIMHDTQSYLEMGHGSG